MRSRFAAFALGDAAYLLRTWHPEHRPAHLDLSDGPTFTRLDVLSVTGGGLFDKEGTVRFRAHYTDGGGQGVLAEHSRFARADGHWVYVDAIG